MHRSLLTRGVGASRASFVCLLALSMVSLAGTPSPASPSGRDLPPKIKESEARSPGYRAPIAARTRASVSAATRLGFCGGDDWEPEITADALGHVYVVWPHFPGDPTCDPASGNPRDVYIQVSNDGGETFGPPHIVVHVPYPSVVDTVVTTNESGVVYVSFIAYGHHRRNIDVIVATSHDFGATFSWAKVNGPECKECDHPWIVAHGDNVYVMYTETGGKHYLARSSDAGQTWTETKVLDDRGVPFAEGAVVDAKGNAWFAWGDCNNSCSGQRAAVYRVSRTLAGTSKTVFANIATAPAGPKCPHRICGFAYFGPQNDIAIDAAGNLYMVWQDAKPRKPRRPPVVKLSRCLGATDCTDRRNWERLGRVDDKTSSGCARGRCYALFPRVEGGAEDRISVIWMDDRNGAPLDHKNGWNVWYRTSITGGESWTGPSVRVSTYDPSRAESESHGFRFPYGDYHGIDITPGGDAVMAWGEGIDYEGGPEKPGHIVYRSL